MNDPLGKWISDVAPPLVVDEVKKEAHLAVLKERLRQRQIQNERRHDRLLRSSVTAAVLVFLMIGGRVADLGSDGFDYTLEKPQSQRLGYANVGLRHDAFNIREDDRPEEITDFAQQVAADLGQPVSIFMYVIEGNEYCTVRKQYQMGDEVRIAGGEAKDRKMKNLSLLMDFLETEGTEIHDQIRSGALLPLETRVEEVEGHSYQAQVYHFHSTNHGEVLYLRGEIIKTGPD